MKLLVALALLSLLFGAVSGQETKAQRDARLKWFREAKFGMFIHWGLYAVPAGKWGTSTRHGEWIRETAQIPVSEYDKLLDQFNPVKFDPDAWMKLANHAGMKYVVITTKHHDGFALFDSKESEFDVMSTPFKRDIMKELSQAARKNGLVQCWYHSIMDWRHPDYLPRRTWEVANRPEAGADMDRYVKFLHSQVSELLTNYGPIGIMWFDGEWERTWNHDRGQPLYDLCRKLQPNVIVNNRVDVGRGGMAGMSDAGYAGDYGTPEQEVPASGIPGVDWESCITMNRNWGFNAMDKDFKSTEALIEMLVDVVSKGGNLLLNVGPKADGTFPEESIVRLQEMGDWMKVNSEAIYGTTASPFRKLDPTWRCTTKGKSLYVFNLKPDTNSEIVLPGLGNKVLRSKRLDGGRLTVKRRGTDLVATFEGKPQSSCLVAKIELDGSPIVYTTPEIVAEASAFVKRIPVRLEGPARGVEVRYTTDGTNPSAKSPLYRAPLSLAKTTTVKARAFHKGKAVSAVVTRRFEKVQPWLGLVFARKPDDGLSLTAIPGDFDRCDDMHKVGAGSNSVVGSVGLGTFARKEYVGLVFEGYVSVLTDEMYAFALDSDDGSRMYIDDKLVIDNDGLHGPKQVLGSAPLSGGYHKIRVEWFNKTGGAVLDLKWGLLGSKLVPIQASQLFH